MGGDADLGGRMETVASRVGFLELLDEEGPLPPRDVVEAMDYSRGTVTRALRELREADLVEKGPGGYVPTLAGAMAAEEYRRYETASRAILSSDDLLAPIPRSQAPPVDLLVGADAILAEAEVPVNALETIADRVQNADTVRAYLPTLVNTHLLRVWHRAVVATAVEGEAILDPDLLTVLKGQYPHLLAEMAAADGFSAYESAGPPYGVILTAADGTTSVTVVVYEGDTAVRGVLTNDAPAAVEWTRAELDRLARAATDVTADLDALSGAVADGLSRPSLGGPGGESRSAGAGPPGDDAGHALPIDLETEGFVRLASDYFDAHGEAAPEVSWRTGFTLAEVRAGHAVDRHDADGHNLTTRVVEALGEGTDQVVLGPPGSGKSTVCMAVACEWFDRGLGPVVYREGGDGDHFESAPLLEAYLRQAGGHALVVVEDAIRDDANAVFEVMRTLDADDSVTFLLDARTHEWRDSGAFDVDARVDAYRRTAVEEVEVPGLDERECERFVAHFTELVDADLDLTGAELFERVEAGTAGTDGEDLPAGDALVAKHYIAQRFDPRVDSGASTATALDEAVRRTYESLADAGEPLATDLAVLVALLTAAGIPVVDEYCYALAGPDEYADLEAAMSLLDGRLLFEHKQSRAGGPTSYRTRHETWATRFLEQFGAVEPPGRARETFGRGITRLLALADDPDRRERIKRHLGGRTPHIHQIEADPGGWADELARRLFSLGRTSAGLAPLFGETGDDAIALPDACSPWTRIQQAYWRGEMNLTYGDLDRAEREFRALGELAETLELDRSAAMPATPAFVSGHGDGDEDVSTHRTRWRATSKLELGSVALARGEIEAAEEYHREALVLFREIDDPEGEALGLKNLGTDAFNQADYDRAREYFERSLDIARERDDRGIEAACLNNLATVDQQLGDLDRAREYYEESLEGFRDVGDRSKAAYILNNLGTVAREQGEFDRARDYHERSIAVFRDLGNQPMEATNFTNLGTAAQQQGDYERAREYYEESLAIERDIGNPLGKAHSYNDLGTLAREQGEFDRASEYHEESLAINRDLENRSGEGYSRKQLGAVARERGDYDRAREHVEASLETFRELGNRHGVAPSHALLGAIAREQGDFESAGDHFDRAEETFEEIRDEPGIAGVRLERGRLALARDDVDAARECAREARETFEELGWTHDAARSRHLLGRVAAAAGDPDAAREHWTAALETFESVGAPQDALETLAVLVETCRAEGDPGAAREWCGRARDVLADAPEATADLHRDRVERHADELGLE